MQQPHLILGIGELLWDLFPTHSPCAEIALEAPSPKGALGGAPANFAVMAGRLGNHAAILSRIGRDELGRMAVNQLESLPVDTEFLQVDSEQKTGKVSVSITSGEPSYLIHQPAAWDFMELTDSWVEAAERADALCFGTLAQRSPQSRQTIQTLVAEAHHSSLRIFDINLRPPFFSGEIIQESLELASVLKLNDSELIQVLDILGIGSTTTGGDTNEEEKHPRRTSEALRIGSQKLLAEFPTLNLIAITRGSHGSLLVKRNEWYEHPGYAVKIADTVGAGDAFTAALAHYLLRSANLATLSEAGNRWGSWVASHKGAMPDLPVIPRGEITAAIED
jgi:fructokinase